MNSVADKDGYLIVAERSKVSASKNEIQTL